MVASLSDDVHFLKAVYRSDRPVGVYRDRHGYRAKVLKRFPLGSYRTERDASVAVVKWYRDRYGDDWRAVLASRHINPVRYVRLPYGGYEVVAWFCGRPVPIRERAGRQTVTYYPTMEMAKAAVGRWIDREFGLFAPVSSVFLYRLSAKFRRRPRFG